MRAARALARVLVVSSMLVCLVAGPARPQGVAAPVPHSAEAVKAAFLYRFPGYVGWPTGADGTPLTIAVMDGPEVADALGRLISGLHGDGRTTVVRAISRVEEIGDARVLYVGPTSARRIRELVEAVGTRPVLVVTDQPDGLAAGATINFVMADRRVRFEASLAAAARSRLELRSGLLSVAQRVEGQRPGSSMLGTPRAQRLYAARWRFRRRERMG
jgi:hypothetical protein